MELTRTFAEPNFLSIDFSIHDITDAMRVSLFFAVFIVLIGISNSGYAQRELSLQQALQQARSGHPTLKVQAFELPKAQANVTTAQLRPNPILNNQTLQLTQSNAWLPNTQWYDPRNQQIWWQLTKPFQLPAQRKARIATATKGVQVQQCVDAEVQRQVLQQVAYKWLDAWTTRKHLELLQKAKVNVDSLVLINQNRLKNQVIPQTELGRTQLLSKQYAVQIESLQRDYDNQLRDLQWMTGAEQLVIPGESDILTRDVTPSLEGLVQQAREQRSDIQTLKASVEAWASNTQWQKAQAYPVPELGMIYNPQNGIPYVGIYGTVALPLFSRNQGEIQKAKISSQQATQQLELTRTQVQTEVTNAYQRFQTQQRNVQTYQQLLQQSDAILSSVRYAYLKGGTSIIDFLEAQRSWLDTRQSYYDTLQAYRMSYIDLLFYTGTIHQYAQ